MKAFFKIVFASMLGTFLTAILSIIIFFIVVLAIFSQLSEKEKIKVAQHSILQIKLDKTLTDRTLETPFEFEFSEELATPIGLNEMLAAIEQAKTDESITGIFLDLAYVSAGYAALEELRQALQDFKSTGKFIVAYADVYTQKAYYLASVADKIYANPQGYLELKGLGAELMFFKNMLEKIGVEAQIIRPKNNNFKSAVEPLFLEKMSNENRLQYSKVLNAMWQNIATAIIQSRGLDSLKFNTIVDNMQATAAKDAHQLNLLDSLIYRDELISVLKTKSKIANNEKLRLVKIEKYPLQKKSTDNKNKIAIIYAQGSIGYSDNTNATDEINKTLANTIRSAREDKDIKGIVFRINSPGGDAMTSEIIWREVMLAAKEKPLVASLGDVAASGGYYIACAADTIIADKNTLTGSIGVFSVIPNAKKMFNDKLGITTDIITTHKMAAPTSVTRPMNTDENLLLQAQIDNIYKTFLQRVADGRKKSIAEVDSIAQGRVWNATDAQKIGLVDKIGGLQDAVKMVAKMANLQTYAIEELPEYEFSFDNFLQNTTSAAQTKFIKRYLLDQSSLHLYNKLEYLKSVQNLIHQNQPQTKLENMLLIY